MTYEEFEWHILRLVYEEGLDRLHPSYLAYALGLSHERVTTFLEQAAGTGLVDMEVTADGRLEYAIPGLDRNGILPNPIWREEDEEVNRSTKAETGLHATAKEELISPEQPQGSATEEAPKELVALTQADATPGGLPVPRKKETPYYAEDRLAIARHPLLPAAVRKHIEAHYKQATDSEFVRFSEQSPILGTQATLEDPTSKAMIALGNNDQFPFRVETCDDTYCDPTQTVFMRQIRVHGVNSEKELRYHVQRLFESFGYRVVQADEDRLRFERGSVTFILALVPLFVLVLPLFVYLFLYCMGRSTIHQEPVELDVQFRRLLEDEEPVYEIDLTFIGLHGVVLGTADQRVLNQEIDTLRDELRWSLSPG